VQEQKEAAMIKALENNMGDVDMVSAESEILGPIACFDSIRSGFGELGVVVISKD
jgi:hypothetical protein